MPLTNFPNGISSFGAPVYGSGLPKGLTDIFFVDYGNGSDGVSKKANSADRPWKTIEYAETRLTTNKNQGIALMGNSTHVLTAMLDWDKNRCHMFGYDPVNRMYGNNAKVSLTATETATNIATMKNSGVRNSFVNIKFMNASTVAEGIYCVAECGEYAYYSHCEFYKSTDTDVALAAELLCEGDSASFNFCTFGDLVTEKGGSGKERPCVILTRELVTGKVSRDVEFNDCVFLQKAAHVDVSLIHSTLATDVERRMIFRRPIFWNAKLASADPAVAITLDNAQTQGDILLIEPVSIGITALAVSSKGVYVVGGSVPADPTTGIAVAVDGS
ncbi:MAG: hypothetical protein SVO01_00180 [Thermotogota bacterium]|nr:hypothetical protein [Thermotogota bacterium]